MSFIYKNGWEITFFNADRMCTVLPRRAFFTSKDAMEAFARRAGGLKTPRDIEIFEEGVRKKFGDITLDLTPEQYAKLRK